MTKHRSPTPIILFIRDICRGIEMIETLRSSFNKHKKKVVPQLRYADLISARTQPPPEIPGGPYHKTSQIYYFTRDGRREVQPPLEIPLAKQIVSGSEEKATRQKYITPGKPLEWC